MFVHSKTQENESNFLIIILDFFFSSKHKNVAFPN